MKKISYSMLVQWILFSPLILPLAIVFGAIEGVRHTMKSLFEQVNNDINKEEEVFQV
jgi:hypothetical protein